MALATPAMTGEVPLLAKLSNTITVAALVNQPTPDTAVATFAGKGGSRSGSSLKRRFWMPITPAPADPPDRPHQAPRPWPFRLAWTSPATVPLMGPTATETPAVT